MYRNAFIPWKSHWKIGLKRKKRICHSFCWFYILIFVEIVLFLFLTISFFLRDFYVWKTFECLKCLKSKNKANVSGLSVFVELVIHIFISTVALYLAFTLRRLKFLLWQKFKSKANFIVSFYNLCKIFFLFCIDFILTSLILLYSYCKDLFYLYCKIPDNFGQWSNMFRLFNLNYKICDI